MHCRFIYRNDDIWSSRVWGPGPAREEAHDERASDENPHQPPRHAHRQGAAGHVSRVTCHVSRVTCPQHCQPCFCRTSLQCSALWKLVSEKLRWIRKCLYKGMDICDLHKTLPGSAARDEDAGAEPERPGAARHPQQDLPPRPHLLPGLLPALPRAVPAGGRRGGGVQEEHVQGSSLHKKLQNNSVVFKILCGTDPLPTDYRAKKYKMEKHRIKKVYI